MVMLTDVRPKALIIKATFASRTRRFAVDGPAARLEKITGMIRDRFELTSPSALHLYYVNGRGEMVYVESESEFADACTAGGVRGHELALIVDRAAPALPRGGLLTKLQQARQATDELERLVDRLHDLAAPADARRTPEVSRPEFPQAEYPGFEASDFHLPQWVSREVLHYETIPAEPPGALSDLEDMEAETDLLASPHPAAGSHDDESEQPILPKAAPMQISLHSACISAVAEYLPIAESALERAFQPYKDEEEQPAGGRAVQFSMRSALVSAVSRRAGPHENGEDDSGRRIASAARRGPRASVPPKVKFQIPFPAFVPFPPSPTRSTPVFSLSETTPFPFRVTAATSTSCACRCSCGDQAPENHAAPAADAAPAVAVGVQTDPEGRLRSKKKFGFSVSVGTQHRADPTPSVGARSESPIRATSSSVGTQSEPGPEEADDSEYEFI